MLKSKCQLKLKSTPGEWQVVLCWHQMCPLTKEDLRGWQVRDWRGERVERWCDSSSNSSRRVRIRRHNESERERGTCRIWIVHCRHLLAQKFEKESALSNGEGLLEKCLCRNVRKALRLGMFSSRGQREENRRCTIYWVICLWRIFKLHFTSPLHRRRLWNSPACGAWLASLFKTFRSAAVR